MHLPCKWITILFAMLSVVVSVFGPPGFVSATAGADNEMTTVRQWVAARFGDVGESMPPFSFTYDGRPSAELLPNWRQACRVRKLDDRRIEHTLTWADPESGLIIRCVAIVYRDFPTVEWTLYFKNTGRTETPVGTSSSTAGRRWACQPRPLLIRPRNDCLETTRTVTE